MKEKLLIALAFVLFTSSFLFGQDTLNRKKNNSFSVNIESSMIMIIGDYWVPQVTYGYLNFEFLQRRKENFANSYSLGLAPVALFDDYFSVAQHPVFYLQYAAVFGKKRHFFEMGTGLVVPTIILNLRLGYRLDLGKRFLFRAAYTPSVYLYKLTDEEGNIDFTVFNNGLSLSLGYRFGIKGNKEKWNNNWGWLSTLQFNAQPFFNHFTGYKGFYFTIGPEFKIFDTGDKLAIKPWIAYAYGPVNYSLDGLSTGMRAVYGKGMHFIEAGIGSVWFPVRGYYSGNYFILQPEIGYRINIAKRLMARVAYTPYWWLSDKNGEEYIEKKFVNCITAGVGYRFH